MKIIDKPSPNYDSREGILPTILLLHYTGMKTADEALDRLTAKVSGVSAHYTIDEDGAVYNHVNEDERAWHAGKSYWQGETNINSVSIGVEIINKGHEFGYTEFPEAQIESVKKLCLNIMRRHNIKYVLAHSDVAPERKQDPGELFPWQDFAKSGVGIWPDEISCDENIDVMHALKNIGYGDFDQVDLVTAFQRHYVPEVFVDGAEGVVCRLTKARLSALAANHLISML